jgi:hypothetical protein
MSTWLAKARAARAHSSFDCWEACANCAKCAKTPTALVPEGGFGTNGTIGTVSNIAADEIQGRFEWVAHRLMEEHGRDAERARRDAWAILKMELLNDVRLAPVQADTHRCFVCNGIDTPAQVLVPVLTARPDTPLWLHLELCYGELRSQRSQQVDELLYAALGPAGTRTSRANEVRPGGVVKTLAVWPPQPAPR